MEKHTPGRLHLNLYGPSQISPEAVDIGPIGYADGIARVRGADKETNVANARRLVAAWNAVEGISTESLESGAVERLVTAARKALVVLAEEHLYPAAELRAALSDFTGEETQE